MPKSKIKTAKPSRSFLMGMSFSITMVFAFAGYMMYGLNQNLQVAQASEIITTQSIANTNQESVKNLQLKITNGLLEYSGLYFSDSNSCEQIETTDINIIDTQIFLDITILPADNCVNFGDILEFVGSSTISTNPTKSDLSNIIVEIK
jgi:hypothetical protein